MAPRSPVFNAIATTAVFSAVAAAFFFQGSVKTAFRPVFDAIEYSRFAYVLCFIGLTAMPEPSPFVIIISALCVFSPPVSAWAWLMSSLEDYQKVMCVVAGVFTVVYWTNGLILLALEKIFANYLQKYRIQKEIKPHSRPGMGKLIRSLVLLNTCFVPVIGLALGLTVTIDPAEDLDIPGPFEMFLSTIAGVLVNEICFFYGHWLMHANKFLYGQVHKVHHEFKAPCALAAIYCHPLELVISDFIPLAAGILLFNKNLYFAAVFTTMAVLGTQTHHCGFRWPWIAGHGNQPDFHDYHHEKFNCNYGNIGFLDALHGTSQGSRRHPIAAQGKENDATLLNGKEVTKAD